NVSSRNGRADRTCLFGKFFRRKCKLSCPDIPSAPAATTPTSRYCAQYSISLLPIRSCLNPQLLVSKSADEKSQSGSRPVGSSSSGSLQMFVHNRLTLTPKTAL